MKYALTKNIKIVARFIAGGAFLTVILFAASYQLASGIIRAIGDRNAGAAEQAIERDKTYALKQVREIADGGKFNVSVAVKDRDHTLIALNDEMKMRKLSAMVAVDADGVTLARVPAIASYGDYIALTQPWGRAAASGESAVMIGRGRTYPLVMMAAAPLWQEERVVGALYGGYLLNDQYVKRLIKTLAPGAQAVVYSAVDGVIGGSFDDPETQGLLQSYFNVGSDWVRSGREGDILDIGGRMYALENIIFPNPENNQWGLGGILLFVPVNFIYVIGLPALAVFLAFLFVVYASFFRWKKARAGIGMSDIDRIVLALAGFAAFALAVILVNWYFAARTVIHVKPPASVIYNATLSFDPDANVLAIGKEHRVAIRLDSGGEAINAVQTVVRYNPQAVEVNDVLIANSLCLPEFFVEKAIDRAQGQVRVACGAPSPGLTAGSGVVAELLVKPLRPGSFSLFFDEGETQVLANDGMGTNVLRMATSANYQVAPRRAEAISGDGETITLFSSSHGNSERWYNRRDVQIYWQGIPGAVYAYALDSRPDTVPFGQVTQETSLMLFARNDGVLYAHVAARYESRVGPVAHFKVRIDTTPPAIPSIRMSEAEPKKGSVTRFEFSSADGQSGLQKNYYVDIDNTVLLPTQPQLSVPFLESGKHSVRVRVFDQAGNFSDNTTTVRVRN